MIMITEQETYNELCYYTLAHGEASFIHQHVVDAYAAQTVAEDDKPIKLAFALVGLYLHVEKQFNDRQIQLVHTKLGQAKQSWPDFFILKEQGEVMVEKVLAVPAGAERDDMIHQWCVSVWEAFSNNQQVVTSLLREHKINFILHLPEEIRPVRSFQVGFR